jgi:hypothetical protein
MGIRKQPPTIPFSSSFSVGASVASNIAVPILTASFASRSLAPIGPDGPCISIITGSVIPV